MEIKRIKQVTYIPNLKAVFNNKEGEIWKKNAVLVTIEVTDDENRELKLTLIEPYFWSHPNGFFHFDNCVEEKEFLDLEFEGNDSDWKELLREKLKNK